MPRDSKRDGRRRMTTRRLLRKLKCFLQGHHDYDMTFPYPGSLDWVFVCPCGKTTSNLWETR